MSEDPATAENLRALRLKISGDENGKRPFPLFCTAHDPLQRGWTKNMTVVCGASGLSHHSDRSLSRFLRAKKTLEPAAKLLGKYEELVEEKGYRSLTFEVGQEVFLSSHLQCSPSKSSLAHKFRSHDGPIREPQVFSPAIPSHRSRAHNTGRQG
jgi:hypothetical protein